MSKITYKDAGVDIDAGDELVRRLKKKLPHVGGFGGAFPFPIENYREPLLVAGTDGVGTKLFLAMKANRIADVGIDLVAMSVNDVVTCGAKPLFFLDYYATGRLNVDSAEKVIDGIIEGCRESDCILLGGETAEMPGMYNEEDFDLAGFAVGVVEKERIIDGSTIKVGDVVIGLPSTGVHSNGYSLVRKIVEVRKIDLNAKVPWENATFGEVLLRPTRLYVRLVLDLANRFTVKGLAHITGGGLPGNANRILPDNCNAEIEFGSWPVLPVFKWLEESGPVERGEMFRTFNMGVGMVVVVPADEADSIFAHLALVGEKAYKIGKIVPGKAEVVIK